MTAVRQLDRLLLDWHDPAVRGLPWRGTRDPYGIMVSEVMTQQTQAERAAASWVSFMRRFPTVSGLASAPVGEVVVAWQGLGYNRRAVNLHRCAQIIQARHAGVVPEDGADLQALPGLGPYTVRAIQSFAFGHDEIPVDTNVARVLSRVDNQVLARPQAQERADGLTGRGSGSATAAALMDLGATICTARAARCGECPLAGICAWQGGPGADPAAGGAHRPRAQSIFEGSRRQARGRVVAAMRLGPVPLDVALQLAGPGGEDLLNGLIGDGLAEVVPRGFALPGWGGKSAAEEVTDPARDVWR
ncbi:MAG: A/G-specific adenine glycosylase [Euzebya sp.]